MAHYDCNHCGVGYWEQHADNCPENLKGKQMAISKFGGDTVGPVYVQYAKDVPQKDHFVILVNKVIYQDTGYGENAAVPTLNYLTFTDIEDVKTWVLNNHSRETFSIIKASPIPFKLTAVLELEKQS